MAEKNKAIANGASDINAKEKELFRSTTCITLDQVRIGLQRNNLLAQNNNNKNKSTNQPFGINIHSTLLPPTSSSYLAEDINAQVNRDNEEIDQLIRSHAEQLKRKLAERDQKQYKCLALAAEGSALKRVKEKEASLDSAVRRIGVLQMEVTSLSRENATWKSIASNRYKDLYLLNKQLNKANAELARIGGAEGCGESDTAESFCFDHTERGTAGLAVPCHECYGRSASVVIMPCCHLCLCRDCNDESEPLPCPVCGTARTGFMHVYFGAHNGNN